MICYIKIFFGNNDFSIEEVQCKNFGHACMLLYKKYSKKLKAPIAFELIK